MAEARLGQFYGALGRQPTIIIYRRTCLVPSFVPESVITREQFLFFHVKQRCMCSKRPKGTDEDCEETIFFVPGDGRTIIHTAVVLRTEVYETYDTSITTST